MEIINTTTNAAEPCKCCGGSGVQRDIEGINRICPCCGGTGLWRNPTITY